MNVPVGAATLATLAFVFSPVAQARQAQTVTIKLTSVTTVAIQHDTKPKGVASKGDSIDFKDLLLNRVAQFGKAKGKPVAYDVGTITYTSSKARAMECLATFPGIGTVTYGGPLADSSGNTILRITKGTGAFKGATGTVIIGNGEKSAPNTYLIHVPHALDIHARGNVA
jgi:hypothetical protein